MSASPDEPAAGVAPGADFYYASLYHPPRVRGLLRASAALGRELLDIPATCSDRGVAHVKLAWWHEELSRPSGTAPRHDLTRAALPLLNADAGWRQTFVELVERLHDSLADHAFADDAALREWFGGLHGGLARLQLELSQPGIDSAHGADLMLDSELALAVLDLRTHRRAGTLAFDGATLARHGLDRDTVRSATHSGALAGLVDDVLQARRAAMAARIARLTRQQRRAQRLPVTLARLTLHRLDLTRADGNAVLERHVAPTPVAKLLTAWRTRYLG